MENINFNNILNRDIIANEIKLKLKNFNNNKDDLLQKRGFYIYGHPGTGKTKFITNLLNESGYDIISYDAGDIRNKTIIETISSDTMADNNIISLFTKKTKPIAIIMDEIDGMNSGDKGGINALIKLIRPKKTKKQKNENSTYCPIFCISNYHIDKKIRELIKTCNKFELKTPTAKQMTNLINVSMPGLEISLISNLINFLQGDLRKLNIIYNIYKNKCSILHNEIIQNIFKPKSYNEDTKDITKSLFQNKYSIQKHNCVMNDTDRTIVGLLYHENIIDILNKYPKNKAIPFYQKILNNICFADYIDRITFQKQIWQFNEMTSLLKTFYNNKIYHDTFPNKVKLSDIRFTKVLTKYSTEYNNEIFIQNLCQRFGLDKKDIITLFLKEKDTITEEDECMLLETYEITNLDIIRIYKYINNYINYTSSEGVKIQELEEL